jgi:hypothetical protein
MAFSLGVGGITLAGISPFLREAIHEQDYQVGPSALQGDKAETF